MVIQYFSSNPSTLNTFFFSPSCSLQICLVSLALSFGTMLFHIFLSPHKFNISYSIFKDRKQRSNSWIWSWWLRALNVNICEMFIPEHQMDDKLWCSLFMRIQPSYRTFFHLCGWNKKQIKTNNVEDTSILFASLEALHFYLKAICREV